MSIFDNNLSKAMNRNNFVQASKMIQINNLQAQLVSTTVQTQIQKNKLNYKYPGSISIAKVHAKASKFGFSPSNKGQPSRVCPCCFNRVQKQQIQICFPTTSINLQQEIGYKQFKLASSVALYFSFIKMLILYFFLRFLICDGFNLFSNIFGTYCNSNKKCKPALWNYVSILNIKQQQQYLFIQDILNLAVIVLTIIYFFFYRKSQYQFHKQLDKHKQCENAYTLYVTGIPLLDFPSNQQTKKIKREQSFQLYHRKHLWQFFQQKIKLWFQQQQTWKSKKGTNQYDFTQLKHKNNDQLRSDQIVKSITLCYDLTRLEILQNNKNKLINQQQLLLQKDYVPFEAQSDEDKNRFSTIPEQVAFLNDCQVVLNKQFASDNSILFTLTHFVGSAFVSFQYQHYRQHILESAERDSEFLNFKGQNLKVQKASHPSDVYWKNLKYTNAQRFKKKTFSYMVLLLVLVFTFLIIFIIQAYKSYYYQRVSQPINLLQNIKIYGLVLLTVLITIIINKCLTLLIYSLTQNQRHATKSNQVLSLTIKIIIAQFLNTAILYYIVSRILEESITSKVGLVLQITSLVIVLGVIYLISQLINAPAIFRYLYLFCQYRNLTEEDTVENFQIQLNKQYKYAQFDMATHYTFYILMALTVSFYAYLVPIIVPIVFVLFILQYWVDKINLLKRSSLKYSFSFQLSRSILKIFQASIMLFALGWGLFSIYVKGSINIFNIIGFGLSFIYFLFLLLGTQKLQKRIFGSYETSQTIIYDDCVSDGKFHQTYWTKNPATYLVKQQDITGKRCLLNPVINKILITSIQDKI